VPRQAGRRQSGHDAGIVRAGTRNPVERQHAREIAAHHPASRRDRKPRRRAAASTRRGPATAAVSPRGPSSTPSSATTSKRFSQSPSSTTATAIPSSSSASSGATSTAVCLRAASRACVVPSAASSALSPSAARDGSARVAPAGAWPTSPRPWSTTCCPKPPIASGCSPSRGHCDSGSPSIQLSSADSSASSSARALRRLHQLEWRAAQPGVRHPPAALYVRAPDARERPPRCARTITDRKGFAP